MCLNFHFFIISGVIKKITSLSNLEISPLLHDDIVINILITIILINTIITIKSSITAQI